MKSTGIHVTILFFITFLSFLSNESRGQCTLVVQGKLKPYSLGQREVISGVLKECICKQPVKAGEQCTGGKWVAVSVAKPVAAAPQKEKAVIKTAQPKRADSTAKKHDTKDSQDMVAFLSDWDKAKKLRIVYGALNEYRKYSKDDLVKIEPSIVYATKSVRVECKCYVRISLNELDTKKQSIKVWYNPGGVHYINLAKEFGLYQLESLQLSPSNVAKAPIGYTILGE